jgi:hypothetical protein
VTVAAVRAQTAVSARPLTAAVSAVSITAARATSTAVARPVTTTVGPTSISLGTAAVVADVGRVIPDVVGWTVRRVGRIKVLPE